MVYEVCIIKQPILKNVHTDQTDHSTDQPFDTKRSLTYLLIICQCQIWLGLRSNWFCAVAKRNYTVVVAVAMFPLGKGYDKLL